MELTSDEIERVRDLVDDPYEDYAFVLYELEQKGVRTVRCHTWCEECEKESESEVDTSTFEWTCPHCGAVSNQ